MACFSGAGRKWWGAGIVLLIMAGIPASANERLWIALFHGQNGPVWGPQAPPPLTARLHEVFGFNRYKMVKEETADLDKGDHWVLSRRDFFLRLQPVMGGQGEALRYEIYKDGFLVATGTYALDPESPLFITGPELGHGRLIFVLQPR